jgi:arginine decarboxylase
VEDLEKIMASMYYVNMSVFQSAPDCWAIDQLFPIMPIHRLDEEPTRRGILADLTCDSDGKIDRFIDLRDVKSVLELHPFKPEEPYYLGMFLSGAYQEIMGNLHNLLVTRTLSTSNLRPRDTRLNTLLRVTRCGRSWAVQYDSEDLIESIRQQTEKALQEKRITLEESQRLLQTYEQSLSRYTYLSA